MFRRIVVGVDGSAPSRNALHWAAREAQVHDAKLEVVHAYPSPWELWAVPAAAPALPDIETAQRDLVQQEIDTVPKSTLGNVETYILNDTAAHALIEHARGADMLVVGSRGHGGFTGLLLGSVSQHVAHHAPCPVVIVPSPKS